MTPSPSSVRRGGVWSPLRSDAPAIPQTSCDVIIPALDEEESIGLVLQAIPKDRVRRIVVVDNGSTDSTAERAREGGAHVTYEPERGYGAACLKGIEALAVDPPDIVVFLDADFSDFPEEIELLLAPIHAGVADLVIGSRMIGQREEGALLPQALFGNRLASWLIYVLTRYRFTDLGPFRAVKWDALTLLEMEDRTYGWTVEMQLKAAHMGLSCVEVPVRYRARLGVSKITGTLKGTLMASYKILWTIASYASEFRR